MYRLNPIWRNMKILQRRLRVTLEGYHCPAPRQIDIELSNRCNLRCPMCWFHGSQGSGDRYGASEFTTAEAVHLIDRLAEFTPAPQLYLGGGEPFIRQDLETILSRIKERGLGVSFTTNGTLITPAQSRHLVRTGVDYINFSIDGSEELHDRRRGDGVFRKVTGAVRELVRAKLAAASGKPVVVVNVTVSAALPGRVKETLQAIREAINDGADFYRIHHQWYVTPTELAAHQSAVRRALGCEATGAVSHLADSPCIEDPSAFAAELEAMRGDRKIICFPNFSPAELADYYSESPRLRRSCLASLTGAVIRPNGDVMFCPDGWIDGYVIGNVHNESLPEIWNGERARRFRAVLMRENRFPACQRCSWMYCHRP